MSALLQSSSGRGVGGEAAGLQDKRGDRGGGRETRTPPAAAAAGGAIPGEEGAAEAESGPSSQRLCLLRSSLERRNQSRGRGWEGSEAGAWAGEGDRGATGVAVATVRRRDSWEGALRPGAAAAERSGGREPGTGAGPARAPGCGTRPPVPLFVSAGFVPRHPRGPRLGVAGRIVEKGKGVGGEEEELGKGDWLGEV